VGTFTPEIVSEALRLLQQEHPLLSACIVRDGKGNLYWRKSKYPVTLEEEVSSLLAENTRDYLLESFVPEESLVILPENRMCLLLEV
jgi:hypothetical protein